MATAETARLTEPHHYLWWFPGSPVKIHLSLRVVDRLNQQILASTPGKAEGLLFGRVREGATEILDFEPAANHNVAVEVGGLSLEKAASLVGYYRAEDGEAFQLDARDHALAGSSFARPHHVFLIVHRNHFGPPTATFFFHDRDGRMADFAFLEFPFESSLLASEQSDRIRRSQHAQPAAPVSPPPAAVATKAVRSRRSSIVKVLGWTCLLVSIAGAGVLFNDASLRQQCTDLWKAVSSSRANARSSVPTSEIATRQSMSLHASRQNGDLALSWDRDSALIAQATSGTLSVQDGNSTRLIAFDASQLRNGSILYAPQSDQILMRLTITTPNKSYTESVTAILPGGGEARVHSAEPPKVAAAPASAPVLERPSTTISPPKAVKAFVPPPPSKNASSTVVAALQEPPTAIERSGALGLLPKILTALPTNLEPPSVLPQPVPKPSLPQPPGVADTYQAPVVITKVEPRFPAELRGLLITSVTVGVRVTISSTGKVVAAEVIPQKNLSRLLANSVVSASRLWKFSPALRNRQPVESESILQFVFKP